MFDDFRIFIDDKRIDYKYEIVNNKIRCNIDINKNDKQLYTFFDENVYDIKFEDNIDVIKENNNKYIVNLEEYKNNIVTIDIVLNYKYCVKALFNFINRRIDKIVLIDRFNLFKSVKDGNKYVKEIDRILEEIDNKDINELLFDTDKEFDRIFKILDENELLNSFLDKMTDKDYMLLITWEISVKVVPEIDQIKFDNIVKEAINYDYSLENVWRLAMSFDERGFDFSKIEEYLVNSKDIKYLLEYVSGVWQADKDRIIKLIIDSKDKNYIKKIVEDDYLMNHFGEKIKSKLIKEIGE